uniref:Uncharacterized protein n=1 Tax=Meloidogyne enterolobii TaxID=390850 RepID=A0A6V7TX98_MELEN|nr:unnamed protein product [Meloidogyne enterolobii]
MQNSVVREYFIDLMRQRDINGHSPFETAIYQRAYSAAQLMWQTAIEGSLYTAAIDLKDWSQDVVDILMPSVGSDDTNEDSSLFILCANDTCSYTWTGEEHTPQKIYECKTCGLVGTFVVVLNAPCFVIEIMTANLKKHLQPLIVTAGRNANVKLWSLEIMQRGNNCFLECYNDLH